MALSLAARHREAVDAMRAAVAALQKTWGEAHPDTATCRSQLGWVLLRAGDHRDAGGELLRALNALVLCAGDGALATNLCRYRIGIAYGASGVVDEAMNFLSVALAHLEQLVGAAHPTAASCRDLLRLLDPSTAAAGPSLPPTLPDTAACTARLRAGGVADEWIDALQAGGVAALDDLHGLTADALPAGMPREQQQRALLVSTDVTVSSWLEAQGGGATERLSDEPAALRADGGYA
eukprot:TRINITY_DN19689_c0_g1_i1.p1 TRINITY_DN19689_c0_g1~~TRINITY_DN19689_c0_g1_i1.p1  ORF type:complete len:267 (+),score=82.87 TRINITY_DN19689_c0_g1_i1:96-803(+)